MLVLLFLTAAVTTVLLLVKASRSGPTPSSSGAGDADAVALGFPPIVARADLDSAPPRVVGDGDTDEAVAAVQQGGTLLVFADPTSRPGGETAKVAIDLHRRLRNRDVRVVLVVPQGSVAGTRTDVASIQRALVNAGVVTDVEVLVDPTDEKGEGRLKRTAWKMRDACGAIVLEDGRESMRFAPPDADSPLQLIDMKRAVDRLLLRHGERPLPPAPPPNRPQPRPEERIDVPEDAGEGPPPPSSPLPPK
jgi:hypothetical protein